jgi:hypothetical protein
VTQQPSSTSNKVEASTPELINPKAFVLAANKLEASIEMIMRQLLAIRWRENQRHEECNREKEFEAQE